MNGPGLPLLLPKLGNTLALDALEVKGTWLEDCWPQKVPIIATDIKDKAY